MNQAAEPKSITFRFLGTGGAFDYEYGNSSVWVGFQGRNILLDCGNSVYGRLRAYGIADQVNDILITHLHDDHAGSLSSIILHQKHVRKPASRPRILYPTGEFGDTLYRYLQFSLQKPELFADFVPLSEVPGIGFIDTKGMHVRDFQTFAYYFETEEELVLYSGDLGNPDIVFEFLERNKLKKTIIFHEVNFFDTKGAHTLYRDLEKWVDEFEIRGYHHDPRLAPSDNRIPLVTDYPELLMRA
jgi:phosphoribosyl 1,2-cyclic phosphodiesterase